MVIPSDSKLNMSNLALRHHLRFTYSSHAISQVYHFQIQIYTALVYHMLNILCSNYTDHIFHVRRRHAKYANNRNMNLLTHISLATTIIMQYGIAH